MTQNSDAHANMGPAQRLFTRVLKVAAPVEPSEFPAMITAFFLFFCVLGGYFAIRPVRETVGTILGRERVADLFGATWMLSIAIIPLYGILCAYVRRTTFLPWVYGFIAVMLAAIGVIFQRDPDNAVWAQVFYVFISVLNLFVISVFWSFLLELFSPEQTKRLFPAIAAGGTTGALVGPAVTSVAVTVVGDTGILFLGASLFGVAIVLQRVLLGIWRRTTPDATLRTVDRPMGGNWIAGITRIVSSPYLLGIALFVVCLAFASTLLYLAQIELVATEIPDETARTQLFSRLDFIVQSLTLLSQVVISGRVAKRWGVTALLAVVPVLMIGGFVGLALFHSLTILLIVFVIRRVGEYAFVRPGRELLFGAVDVETKYKVKNTVDVPIYRGGDYLAGQLETGLTARGVTPQGIAMLGAGIAVVWAATGFFLGRKRESMEKVA